ncbi:MAG: hypothetical protein WD276_03595 [Actinomycetota bacterium]
MLIPQQGFPVREYDAIFVVTPTSKFGHQSDTVMSNIELLVENNTPEPFDFPFMVLTTDPGTGANPTSLEPRVLNGSQPMPDLTDASEDEVDEEAIATTMVAQARAAGITDETQLTGIGSWVADVLRRAERIQVGRTRIDPNMSRRIILQQRLRVLPGEDGRYIFETIAPPPVSTLLTGGRVSVVAVLPWEDEDIHTEVLKGTGETTLEYDFIEGAMGSRKWVAWHWRNDPLLRLAYRYN